MKIVSVSDLHCNSDQLAWVTKQTCDLLLFAGDIANRHHQRETMQTFFENLPAYACLSTGNHDEWLTDFRSERFMADGIATINDYIICALPWRYDTGDWYDNALRSVKSAQNVTRNYIVITHFPALESVTSSCDATLKLSESIRPAFAISGHMHEISGRPYDWYRTSPLGSHWINVGQNDTGTPNHCVIDTTTREITAHILRSEKWVQETIKY